MQLDGSFFFITLHTVYLQEFFQHGTKYERDDHYSYCSRQNFIICTSAGSLTQLEKRQVLTQGADLLPPYCMCSEER
jgi:hypothetical protein